VFFQQEIMKPDINKMHYTGGKEKDTWWVHL